MKIDWKVIGNGVAKVAPWVGSLLGGPAGSAVGNLVAEVLGTDPTPEAVDAELAKNPDAFIKVREMETTKAIELARLQSEDYRATLNAQATETAAEIDDRKNARERDRDFQAKGLRNTRANWMIVFDTLGLIACLAVLIFFRKEVPPEVVALLTTIASIFGLCLRDAHQFEFGSSRGSRDKDLLLAAAQPVDLSKVA